MEFSYIIGYMEISLDWCIWMLNMFPLESRIMWEVISGRGNLLVIKIVWIIDVVIERISIIISVSTYTKQYVSFVKIL